MRKLHNASIRVIAHATEDEKRVKETLLHLIPEGLHSESEIVRVVNKGHYGNPITTFETTIKKQRHLNQLLEKLRNDLSKEDKEKLTREIDKRISENGALFLRFSKQAAYDQKRLKLTDTGDAIHIRLNFALYPIKKEKLLEKIREEGLMAK